MQEITPEGIRLGAEYKALSLEAIASRWNGSDQLGYLVETLAASPVANELFASTSMGALLITPDEKYHAGDNLLSISYLPGTREFEFEHLTIAGKNDRKTCDEREGLRTLSLFLKYKFGVLFEIK